MIPDFPIVVLLSGRGSNFSALLHHLTHFRIAGVVSDKPEAPGLTVAREAGIEVRAFGRQEFPSKLAQKEAIYRAAESFSPKLIVLAGFMQIVEASFVEKHFGKILNIHPSLLPKHPGLHTHERALESGDTEHGCTVHFVDSGVDTGPIVAQASTKIIPGESAETLAARVLELEHKIYPWVISNIAQGLIAINGREVSIQESARREGAQRGFRTW
jgi:phosphoribosylglycinamide formyltransferase-1